MRTWKNIFKNDFLKRGDSSKKAEDLMNIKISRDSVCMGDYVFNHSIFLNVSDKLMYEELFSILKRKSYFPIISGNNVVWVLTSKKHECIFSYFTKTDKLSMGLSEHSLKDLCDECYDFHLRYYSCTKKWKEKILYMYHNDTYSLRRDGWLEEIKYCELLDG